MSVHTRIQGHFFLKLQPNHLADSACGLLRVPAVHKGSEISALCDGLMHGASENLHCERVLMGEIRGMKERGVSVQG